VYVDVVRPFFGPRKFESQRNEEKSMKELDLRVLWDLLLRNLRIIILFVAVVAVIFAGVTVVFQEDLYRSRCSMYVMNITQDSAGQTTGISSAGLDASQRMVNEFIAILRSDSVIYDVQQELKEMNYNYSVSGIKSSLAMTAHRLVPSPGTSTFLPSSCMASMASEVADSSSRAR